MMMLPTTPEPSAEEEETTNIERNIIHAKGKGGGNGGIRKYVRESCWAADVI
jgi:hypothetical protein